MSIAAFLPPIPQPPHDPTAWLLDARVGWQQQEQGLDYVEQLPVQGSLVLTRLPAAGRSLTEASGSFGGLTLPANVVLGPDGSLYLLDRPNFSLKRFDPCDCAFKPVPCFGGAGKEPRQLREPHGIGICCGNLFVCDTGNHRLSVFSLKGLLLRGHWQPPPSAALGNRWEPYAIACDGRGRVFVSDGVNGCVHRFAPTGRWETCLSGLGKVTWLAIDSSDRLYAVVEGVDNSVLILSSDGDRLGTANRPEKLAGRFPPLPLAVDAAGNLYLAPLCSAASPSGQSMFDLQGNPVTVLEAPLAVVYETAGKYLSRALDSQLYRCQWHRLILRGEIPAGASVRVSTFTAEALLSDQQVQSLPETEWETRQDTGALPSGEWDCLVRSGGGRYLWLRLEFRGNGKVTPRLDAVMIEFPRISLRRYLPAVFGAEPASTDFTDRFLALFDTTLRSIEASVDQQARLFDPLSAPAVRDPDTGLDFLSWLGSWIGLSLDRHWPEAKRRQLLKRAGQLYDLRGTREGLWRQLLLLLEMEPGQPGCRAEPPRVRCHLPPLNCAPPPPLPVWQPPPLILEHYRLRRWLFVGAGRLGDQAVLWGKRIVNRSQLNEGAQVGQSQLRTSQDPYRDPFHVYAHRFTVFVPACYRQSEQRRKALENLLKAESPAYTQYQIEYVEPRLRIGFQSMIGLDSVIGRRPAAGVILNTSPLGSATVLGAAQPGGPTLQIGRTARIGATTKLA